MREGEDVIARRFRQGCWRRAVPGFRATERAGGRVFGDGTIDPACCTFQLLQLLDEQRGSTAKVALRPDGLTHVRAICR